MNAPAPPPRFRRRWLRRAMLGLLLLAAIVSAPFVLAYRSVTMVATGHTVHSNALAMDRRVTVYVPAGYDATGPRRYPVLYSLDGQRFRHGALPAMWVRILSWLGLAPPVIVVAIDSEGTRDVDMRPPNPAPLHDDPPIAGRDAAFTAFLREELMPFVERNYRASAYRIVSGHSLGGFYAVERLSRSPELFQAHFAYSPTFSHDRGSLVRLERTASLTRQEPALIYMNIGEESAPFYLSSFMRAARLLRRAPPNTRLIAQAERTRGLFHSIVMIPGQARALHMLGRRANPCALRAPSDRARAACYTGA